MKWCDAVAVLLHACEDATPRIIEEIALEHPDRKLHVLVENDRDWREAAFRQRLLNLGRSVGGTHFAIVDADEVLTADLIDVVRNQIAKLRPRASFEVPLINLWRSMDIMGSVSLTLPLAFADGFGLMYKARPDGYQLHFRFPKGLAWKARAVPSNSGLMHLQRVNWDRAVSRTTMRKMDETVRWPNHRGGIEAIEMRYSSTLLDPKKARHVPVNWWAYELDRGLIDINASPWEKDEVTRLITEYGPDTFAGLRLNG